MMEVDATVAYSKRWIVLWSVGIATLLSTLNNSIVNTILPIMEHDLHIRLGQSEWIVLMYLLVLSLLLLPMGRLSDFIGRRRLFLVGFLLFAIAAVVCGITDDYGVLVFGRGLMAVAGSMLLSVGPALLTTTFPRNQRGKALGLQALMTYLGLALGPVVGGALTDWLGWNSVFYLTIPFALAGFLLALWSVPQIQKSGTARLDVASTATFILSLAALVLLLNSSVITSMRGLVLPALAVLFCLTAFLFIRRQLNLQNPLVDLPLFRVRNFGFGTLGAILNYLCFFVALFLLPFYLTRVLHDSAGITGLWMTLMPLVMMISAPLAGAWSDRVGSRILSSVGMAANALGLAAFAVMAVLGPSVVRTSLLLTGLLVTGLGTGLFAAPNNAAILKAAPQSKQGMASGTLATARYVGMMAGITIGGSLMDYILVRLTAQPSSLSGFEEAVAAVMWIGTAFGILGMFCTLAMQKHRLET
ncbi:MAG: MFS transporter [Alicyclobacillaceae bacterium]|nr:MFS transporter [Alicyclobacillaceae bacterium]